MNRTRLLHAAALAGLVLLAHVKALGGTFHYDDFHSLVDNPSVRDFGQVGAYFSDPQTFSADPQKSMYRPLLLLSYALNYAVAGYEASIFIAVNVAIHLGCTLLVWLIGRRLAEPAAWWAAALFAVHPLASEPVNYVSSRSESLAALWMLAAFYVHSLDRRLWQGVGLGLFVLGLLTKSVAVVLPALLLGRAWYRREPLDWRGHLPYWATALAYVALLQAVGFLGSSLAAAPRGLADQWATQAKAWVYYLKLALLPHSLSVEHGFVVSGPTDAVPWAAAALLASLAWALGQRGRRALFWGAWAAIALLPASVVPLNVLVNEHRLYLAGVGLAFLLAPLLGRVAAVRALGALPAALRRHGPAALTVALLALMSMARSEVWRDAGRLWGDAAAKAPYMSRPQAQWGHALLQSGDRQGARAAFARAVALDPGHRAARTNLANMRYEEALSRRDSSAMRQVLAAYEAVVAADSTYGEALNGLGSASMFLGDTARAESAFRQLAKVRPNMAAAHYNLGLLAAGRGAWDEAAAAYGRAADLAPDAETWFRLGNALAQGGRLEEAAQAYRRAATLDTRDPRIVLNWGEVLLVLGQQAATAGQAENARAQWQAARHRFTQTLGLDPGNERAARRLHQLEGKIP